MADPDAVLRTRSSPGRRYATSISDRRADTRHTTSRNLDVVPKAVEQDVQVEDTPPMTVVSFGTRGGYDYAIYMEGIERLQNWLAAHPEYSVVGPPRRFFYDGPFIPDVLKRSDIQIPVQRR